MPTTHLHVRERYTRLTRPNYGSTELKPGLSDPDRKCIICGRTSEQSIYYPPQKIIQQMPEGTECFRGYVCYTHYAKYRYEINKNPRGIPLQDFVIYMDENLKVKELLPGFQEINGEETWYTGMGASNVIRVGNEAYKEFKVFCETSMVRYVNVGEGKAMFLDWASDKGLTNRDKLAFEHFLQL